MATVFKDTLQVACDWLQYQRVLSTVLCLIDLRYELLVVLCLYLSVILIDFIVTFLRVVQYALTRLHLEHGGRLKAGRRWVSGQWKLPHDHLFGRFHYFDR